ncbi:MAG TPA: gliding motility-associated C-terminal domain-containing protein, partial [Bacteroidia bacterium]|nr:gliding motility-associated C-terminal domain-containing protein [Bacteroidia bacterium]
GNPISCFGECDGSAFATVTGGSPPYIYDWSQVPPATTNAVGDTVSGLCADTLILLVTDTNGCFARDTVFITEPPVLTATDSVSVYAGGWNVTCNGACDGTSTAIPSGGVPPYTFVWSTGCTTAMCDSLCAGTYTVTVTDANGCDTVITTTLFEPPALTLSLTPSIYPCGSNVSCIGACDGSISTTAGGGTAPYGYAWSFAPCSGPSCSNLCAGTYTVTITDANGCTLSASITLSEPPALAIDTIWADTCIGGWNICCFYDTTGCMYTIASGGCPPYSYLWSNGDTLSDACNVVALTYTITVTDVNGCSVTGSITLTEPQELTATISAIFYDTTNVSCNAGCDGVATVFPVGGTPPYSYVWSSSPLDTLQSDSNLCAGTYCVTVTDANGCDTVYCITLTEPTVLNVTISDSSIACDTACTNTITANPSGGIGPYTYLWTSSGPPVQCPTCPSNDSVCVATYTVLITDVNGCTATASITLNPAATSLTVNITGANYNGWGEPCNGDCLDSLFVTTTGGTPPYVYTWSTPCTNDTCLNICAGVYTVTVTDANGCSGISSTIVIEPPLLTVVATAIPGPCNGDCLGQVSAAPSGGTPPIQYLWSNGCTTATCDSLCVGTYTVTVTDANGCTATASVTLTEPPLLVIDSISLSNFNGWNVRCNGDCDGYATVYPSGGTPPYQYVWSTTDTLQTDSNLCAGIYCVTVTDANGCTVSACDTLIEPPVLMVTAVIVNDSCFDLCHGAIDITASGGTPGYWYDWDDIPGSPDIEDRTFLCDGTYIVTVTDTNGCTVTDTFTVTEPLLLTIAGTVINDSCFQECQGEINITVGGGTLPYTYNWSDIPGNPPPGPSEPQNRDTLCAGTYTVTVTDSLGCTATMSFTISEPPQLTVTDTVSLLNPPYNTSCPDACDAWAQIFASGGTPPYTYLWSTVPPLTTDSIDSLCGSFLGITYFYTVTDANGCSVTDSILVVDPYQPISIISTNDTNICGNSILLIANTPLPIYTGHWEIISGCGVFTPDSLSPVVQVNSLCWGSNCFVWVVGDTDCTAYDTVCIRATAPVYANAGTYGFICEEDEPINLHADTAYVGVGTWSAVGADSLHPSPVVFGNVNDPNTFAYNFGWGTNTIVWTVVDGPCRDADTVLITKLIPEVCKDSCLEMPTAFSPNGDGYNDHFVIHCIEYSFNRDNKLIIFNRWGNEVYSKDDYLNEWYGQNNDGGLLPDGTYFAILTITNPGINQGKVLKGYVDLRR